MQVNIPYSDDLYHNFQLDPSYLEGMALKYLSPELRADRNLVHLACQKQPGALKHVAPEPCFFVENVCVCEKKQKKTC